MNRRRMGDLGEDSACRMLAGLGMEILDRNYTRRGGELDIVARDGAYLVFVEVKKRSGLRYGRPAEAVGPTKRARIVRTAIRWLSEHDLDDVPVRFDIVEVLPGEIRHIPDAFDATDLPLNGQDPFDEY